MLIVLRMYNFLFILCLFCVCLFVCVFLFVCLFVCLLEILDHYNLMDCPYFSDTLVLGGGGSLPARSREITGSRVITYSIATSLFQF